jgi:hypothetical protein
MHPIPGKGRRGHTCTALSSVQCRCGGGSLRVFERFSWLEVDSLKMALPRPTHAAQYPEGASHQPLAIFFVIIIVYCHYPILIQGFVYPCDLNVLNGCFKKAADEI